MHFWYTGRAGTPLDDAGRLRCLQLFSQQRQLRAHFAQFVVHFAKQPLGRERFAIPTRALIGQTFFAWRAVAQVVARMIFDRFSMLFLAASSSCARAARARRVFGTHFWSVATHGNADFFSTFRLRIQAKALGCSARAARTSASSMASIWA